MANCLRQLRRDALPSRHTGDASGRGGLLRPSTLIFAATAGLMLGVVLAKALVALFAGT
jgi:hypothetical protein